MGAVGNSNNNINLNKQVNNNNVNQNTQLNNNNTNQIDNKVSNNNINNNINTNNQVNINNSSNLNTTGEVNKASSFNFNQATGVGGQVDLAGLNARNTPRNNNNERVDLSSASSINRFINTYTQVDAERRNTTAESQCGATSVVAASMMAGGKDGMNTLVETIKRRGGINQEQQQRVNEISGRINNNQVTRGDVEFLQGVVYQQLQSIDSRYNNTEGVDMLSIQEYCRTSTTPLKYPSIENAMSRNNLHVLAVDTNGSSGSYEHFVVSRENDNGNDQIFDPWPRRGGQLTSDENTVNNYYESVVTVNYQGRDMNMRFPN